MVFREDQNDGQDDQGDGHENQDGVREGRGMVRTMKMMARRIKMTVAHGLDDLDAIRITFRCLVSRQICL